MSERRIKAYTARTLLHWPSKTSAEALDYGVDWTDSLPKGDGIKSSAFLLPPGIVATDSSNTMTDTEVTIAGGIDGQVYSVIHTVKTEAGRVLERVVKLRIRDR